MGFTPYIKIDEDDDLFINFQMPTKIGQVTNKDPEPFCIESQIPYFLIKIYDNFQQISFFQIGMTMKALVT